MSGCQFGHDADEGFVRCGKRVTHQARYSRGHKTGTEDVEVCDLCASRAQWDGAEIWSYEDGRMWGEDQ